MAGGGRSSTMCFAVAFVLVAVTMFQSSEAATHVVGDASGWIIPPAANEDLYENWVMGKTFTVGDVLVFNFPSGAHDVAEVSKQNLENCIGTNPIKLTTASPANITLATAGMHYFICTKPTHCTGGQEIEISVMAATTTGSSSGPSSSPGTTTTTTNGSSPANSSSSMIAASVGVFAAAFATIVAFFY